jgi:hypothetical protein
VFLVVLFAAIPVYLSVRDWRFVHWMNADSLQTTATVVTYDRPLLKYSYTVGQRRFEGSVKTSTWFQTGDKFDVFFSTSHPWMSSIQRPPLSFDDAGYLATGLFIAVLIPTIALIASLREEKSVSSGNKAPRENRAGEFPTPPARPR